MAEDPKPAKSHEVTSHAESKKADKYAGIPTPPAPRPASAAGSTTIEGGAYWVNGELRNGDGEPLSPEKIEEFRKLHAPSDASHKSA